MARHKTSSRKNIFGLLFMIAAVLLINGLPSFSMTQAVMEKNLQQLNAELIKLASEKGIVASFSYDTLDLQGWGAGRRAVLANPRIEITEDEGGQTRKTLIRTDSAVVTGAGSAGSLAVEFPQPLQMIENDHELARVEFARPPFYLFEPSTVDGKKVMTHKLMLPGNLSVFMPEGERPSEPVRVSFDDQPLARLDYFPEEHRQQLEYRFTNLRIEDSASQISIGEVNTQVKKQFDDENKVVAEYEFIAKDVMLPEMSNSGPVTVEASLGYTGEADAQPLSDAPRSGINELTIKRAVVTSKLMNASMAGALKRSGDDPLPYGKLDITLRNIAAALEQAQLSPEQRNLWTITLQRITGQTAETLNEATFALSREKHGEFMLGATNLQEVVGMLFSQYLKSMAMPDNSPPAAPVELQEMSPEGARP